eukprot:scaffold29246_cov66-Phaeocystis_antarctica.AAC.9
MSSCMRGTLCRLSSCSTPLRLRFGPALVPCAAPYVSSALSSEGAASSESAIASPAATSRSRARFDCLRSRSDTPPFASKSTPSPSPAPALRCALL